MAPLLALLKSLMWKTHLNDVVQIACTFCEGLHIEVPTRAVVVSTGGSALPAQSLRSREAIVATIGPIQSHLRHLQTIGLPHVRTDNVICHICVAERGSLIA